MPRKTDRQRTATAKATAEAYVRQQQTLARTDKLVELPRVVKAECNSKEPHYLIYLTKDEIAHVLAVTAKQPTGHMHSKKVLCAPSDPIGELFATPARAPIYYGRTFPVGTLLTDNETHGQYYVYAVRGPDGYDGAEYQIRPLGAGTDEQLLAIGLPPAWLVSLGLHKWHPINEVFELYGHGPPPPVGAQFPPPPPPQT